MQQGLHLGVIVVNGGMGGMADQANARIVEQRWDKRGNVGQGNVGQTESDPNATVSDHVTPTRFPVMSVPFVLVCSTLVVARHIGGTSTDLK
jgi:hypothetical protein